MVAQLIRLKLKITWNTLRHPTWVLVVTILGVLYGVTVLAGLTVGVVFGMLHGVNLFPVWILAGGVVLLGWVIGPALFSSLDNTLDPRRFAPHVGPSAKLAMGLVAGTGIGIAGFFTSLAVLIPVISMLVGGQYVAALAAFIFGFAGLFTAFMWSRALTTWMGVMVEASGKRDLYTTVASLLILVLCVPMGLWMQMAGDSVEFSFWKQLSSALAWTPFGAPWAISQDATNEAWGVAAVRLIVMAVWSAMGWALWMRVLPWAMSGTANKLSEQIKHAILRGDYRLDSGHGSADAVQKDHSNKQPKLVGMRGVEAWQRLGLSPAAASLAKRTAKDWVRDPRLLANVVAVILMAVVGCFAQFLNTPVGAVSMNVGPTQSVTGVFLVIFAPLLLGAVVGALDTYESTGMWIFVASGMRGRDNRLARLIGSLPVAILVIVLSCGLFSWLADLSAASTALLAAAAFLSFSCTAAVTLVENARWVSPVQPPGTSAFSSKGTGQFTATMVIQLVGWLAAFIVALPGTVLLVLAASTSWIPVAVAVVIAVAWSIAALVAGVIVGGTVWDRYSVSVLTKIKSWPGH